MNAFTRYLGSAANMMEPTLKLKNEVRGVANHKIAAFGGYGCAARYLSQSLRSMTRSELETRELPGKYLELRIVHRFWVTRLGIGYCAHLPYQ